MKVHRDLGEPPSGSSHFDVLVLGPFSLYRDGRPLDWQGWQRKVQTLFRILVTSHENRRSRDELIDLLWPEAQIDAGGRNLRVVLHMLRRGLGSGEPSPVLSEGGWIALNPSYEWDIDLERFEALASHAPAQIAALEEVAGYHRGEPLTEDRYDDWAAAVRSRVQHRWRDLCLRLARLHSEAGAPETALGWLDRIVLIDPLDEEAIRGIVSSLGEMGRRAEAVRRFQRFAQQLKHEMELSPSRETLEVVARVRAKEVEVTVDRTHEASAAATVTRPVPVIPQYPLLAPGRLIGRERELGRVLWILPPLHAVAQRLALISGEQGIGKTRLLAAVAERSRAAGLLTLAGGCYQHEGQLPYGPIRDALSDYLEDQPESVVRAQLERLLPALSSILPEVSMRFPNIPEMPAQTFADVRLPLFLAVTKTLERIGQESPLVLILDDLHWADEATAQLLHFVVRRLGHNRVLIVGAYRTTPETTDLPVAAMAAEMEYNGWATRIPLGPLSNAELAQVLEEHIRGRCAPDLTASLHTRSSGNPFTALQLLRLLQAEGRLERSLEGWRLNPPQLAGDAPLGLQG